MVQLTQPTVEGQAREATEEERRGIDEVGREIQHLAVDCLVRAHYIFYILQVPSGPEVDEEEA